MYLTYALGLIADYDAETAGSVINRVWEKLETDPHMKQCLRKAAAVEGSNARRIERAFRELTGLPLIPNPLSYVQGFFVGTLVPLVPTKQIIALFDSGFFDRLVEIYWGLKLKYDDPRGRELFEAMIATHKAEFALFKTEKATKRARDAQPARGASLPS